MVINVPVPANLPAPLKPKDMTADVSLDAAVQAPVASTNWQTAGILKGLWPMGEKVLKQIGFTKTSLAWMDKHPDVAAAWECVLDTLNVPCPLPATAGGIGAAALTLMAWSMSMYAAVKEDTNAKPTTGQTGGISSVDFTDPRKDTKSAYMGSQ